MERLSFSWLAGSVVIAAISISPGLTAAYVPHLADVVVASGKLEVAVLDKALFHIGEFWMRVPAGTEFNRWLSQGIREKVVISIVADVSRFADAPKVRILQGTLIHVTAPNPTEVVNDVTGRLPSGNLLTVHALSLQNDITGSLGPITFQTADAETAAKFDAYDGTLITMVIQLP